MSLLIQILLQVIPAMPGIIRAIREVMREVEKGDRKAKKKEIAQAVGAKMSDLHADIKSRGKAPVS